MAVTYTITGALFAAAGKQVQAVFQQPWIIVLFAALFVAMALSMFGLYTVQMPGFIQTRVAQLSNRQRGGSFGGVAVMGMLSALIVTTCVGAGAGGGADRHRPDAATSRAARLALFAMSLGMGAPLLVVGSSAGRWMPRAGAWMDGGQAAVRRADAGAGRLDARAHRAGALDAAAVRGAGHRRGDRVVGLRAGRACAPGDPLGRRPRPPRGRAASPALWLARGAAVAVGAVRAAAAGRRGPRRRGSAAAARRAPRPADEPAFTQHRLGRGPARARCRPPRPRTRR